MCGWKDRCRDGNLRTYCQVSPILFGWFFAEASPTCFCIFVKCFFILLYPPTRKVERQPHVLVISADPPKKLPAVLVIMLVLRRKGQPPVPVIWLTMRRGQLPG